MKNVVLTISPFAQVYTSKVKNNIWKALKEKKYICILIKYHDLICLYCETPCKAESITVQYLIFGRSELLVITPGSYYLILGAVQGLFSVIRPKRKQTNWSSFDKNISKLCSFHWIRISAFLYNSCRHKTALDCLLFTQPPQTGQSP